MNAVLEPPRHRFDRTQFERMLEAGVFGPDDRLELLDGEIIDMTPQKSRHATAVTLVGDALRSQGNRINVLASTVGQATRLPQ